MKIILSTLMAVALAAVSVSAQGLIQWGNTPSTKISTNSVIGGGATGVIAGAGNYRFALFYSTTATSVNGQTAAIIGGLNFNGYAFNDGQWHLAAYATNAASVGRFSVSGVEGTAIPDLTGGANAQFVVIGWQASIGPDIPSLQSWIANGQPTPGMVGQSAVSGPITLGNGVEIPTSFVFGAVSGGFIPGFTLGLANGLANWQPFIYGQPTNAVVPPGATAIFAVFASGGPTPAYQWRLNDINVPGANSSVLTIPNAQATNAGSYYVVVSNYLGMVTSSIVVLTVTPQAGVGYVIFANNNVSATKIFTNSSVGGVATGLTAPDPGLYRFGLFASATATSVNGRISSICGSASANYAFNDANWTLVAYGTNAMLRGRLLSANADGLGQTPLYGFPGGSPAQFVVIGWSANIGTSIASVQSWFRDGNPISDGWIGQSAVSGPIMPGDGVLLPAMPLFAATNSRLQGFTLGLASPNAAAVYALPYAPPAVLQVRAVGSNLQLSWPTASGSFGVQSASSPAGPWSDTALAVAPDGSNSVVTVPTTNQLQFYRLMAQ